MLWLQGVEKSDQSRMRSSFTEPEGRIQATKGELFPIVGRFIYGYCTGSYHHSRQNVSISPIVAAGATNYSPISSKPHLTGGNSHMIT